MKQFLIWKQPLFWFLLIIFVTSIYGLVVGDVVTKPISFFMLIVTIINFIFYMVTVFYAHEAFKWGERLDDENNRLSNRNSDLNDAIKQEERRTRKLGMEIQKLNKVAKNASVKGNEWVKVEDIEYNDTELKLVKNGSRYMLAYQELGVWYDEDNLALPIPPTHYKLLEKKES